MGSYLEEIKRLNDTQKAAVEQIDGPLMVIAGPGTGKTQLLSMRVAQILQKTDANPTNILCLTFTEAAARNMRDRLAQLIGDAANHVGIYTFHGFGSEIIQRYPEFFNEHPLLKPVEELGSYETLADIFSHLGHNNALQAKLDEDFLHLRSSSIAISWLKQAGIAPEDLATLVDGNKAFIDFANPLVKPVFAEKTAGNLLATYQNLLTDLRKFTSKAADQSLAQQFSDELATAIEEVNPEGRYAPAMTAWRNKWLSQNLFKVWHLSDQRRTRFLEALSGVYSQYQQALAKKGWYTYDDMILRTINALESEPELRLTLQEQYQYIMVDEYQDTNGAQNKLLELLADNPVHEGQPNLMVVGDDDQAIYRFQGADLSVMLDFIKRWRNVERIVLDKNYRSGNELLKLSREVILHGQERLENQVEGISKELSSGYPIAPPTVIKRTQAISELDQYAEVAKTVAGLIKGGKKPSEIAILAPKHNYLRSLVPYLLDQKLPVSYERREHILNQPKIVELLTLAELVQAAADGQWGQVDALLPKVLAAEYWQIDPMLIWNISVEAYKTKKLWLEIMLEHKNIQLQNIAQALPVLAGQANVLPLDTILDILIGNQPILIGKKSWKIPYRSFYFSEIRLNKSTQEYFVLLGQISTLRERLKEYHPGQPLTLANLLQFVNLYQRSNLNLLDTNPHTTNPEAIELMTAYKAKGLEWDTVFVLGAHEDVWGSRVRSSNYSFGLPHNLEWVKPARDSEDDRLRLFYVAITRAKNNLYLTGYDKAYNGKLSQALYWLSQQTNPTRLPASNTADLIHSQEIHWGLKKVEKRSLQDSLKPFIDTYQLSATHLNSFLDLTRGGPKHFFFRHMLHFPEAITPSSVYGSVVHEVLHYMHVNLTKTGRLPKLSFLQSLLEQNLKDSALLQTDKSRLIERGYQTLSGFYPFASQQFLKTDKSETNFKNEGIVLGDARLTGKIDALRQVSLGELEIIDYKTGIPLHDWHAKGAYPQVRSHLYQQQLVFYQLMVNGSAHYKDQKVSKLALQFVEPDEDGQLSYLTYQPSQEDLDRLRGLIKAVWQHITDLDFPETRQYSLDPKGVKQFENDLLSGKI
ncbi:MAG: ATP-dependent DNA helicase [Candidatus Saccharibacteria bacterium]